MGLTPQALFIRCRDIQQSKADGKQECKVRKNTWRSLLAIYLILGVLSLVACVSIAISNNGADTESEINGKEIEKESNIYLGEDNADK